MSQPNTTTITVLFTPPVQPSEPGTWQFLPTDRAGIPHDQAGKVIYELQTVDLDQEWAFRAVTLGKNFPEETTFVSVQATTKEITFPGLGTVRIEFEATRIEIEITNENERAEGVVLGIALTVGDGTFLYSSRDPQIVLPPSGGEVQS